MNTQTVDIIKNIVASLGVDLNISSVVVNGDGTFTLLTDCTWWLSINQFFVIDGNVYKINSFTFNTSLIVTPQISGNVPTVGLKPIPAPQFIHGTLKMAQNEVDASLDKTILCPFVYLYEIIKDKKNTDEESMVDRETDLRMFFLNSVDTPNWLTQDHYTYFVNPMQQMVDLFISKVNNSSLFTFNLDYECTPLINVSENGTQEKSIFDCNLSGIELRLFAEVREDLSCSQKCGCIK